MQAFGRGRVLCALVCASNALIADDAPSNVPSPSVAKRAFADTFVQRLEDYQRESRAHQHDDPASRWVAFPGHGYRLLSKDDGAVSLVAHVAVRATVPTFSIAVSTGSGECQRGSTTAAQ